MAVQRTLAGFIATLLCFASLNAQAAAHARTSLALEAAAAEPGATVFAALRFEMEDGWHIYWKNGGEGGLGQPPKITWQLPPGVTVGEILWPVPEKLPVPNATTYTLHGEVALLVPLKLPADLKPGLLEISAKIVWLECEKACVQSRANVTNRLEIAAQMQPSGDAALFAMWRGKLPQTEPKLTLTATWAGPATGDTRPLLLEWPSPNKPDHADFFPNPAETFEVGADTEALTDTPGKVRLRKLVQKSEGDWPQEVSGLAIMEAGGQTEAAEVKATVGEVSARTGAATMPAAGPNQSLGLMLLYAFLGGLILNVMPCVLPVIALKILGFVSQAKQSPRRVRQLGLLYTAGVLVSFLVLAAFVIGIQSAGQRAGWGMQFSNPYFIVALTALVTLVALNLFGVFEVTLSGRVMGAAGDLAAHEGGPGAFFNGVLATVLATPCTAPYLGFALGFAFSQSAAIIALMFLTVGLGLAAPYLVLSWQPGWLKFLPKPDAWMEKFKIAMGFPMLATAVWLASLATSFYGERTWWLGVFLVCLGAAAWTFGEFFQRGSKRRGLALVITLLLLFVGYAWALNDGLRWRAPDTGNSAEHSLNHAPEGYAWRPWTTEAVTEARVMNRVVVVDFTAKWCQICNVSVKPAFESKAVTERLRELDAVALLADYTLRPQTITDELAKFNRAGVPMVLVYPRDRKQPPVVLREPLPYPASYSPEILDALDKAAR